MTSHKSIEKGELSNSYNEDEVRNIMKDHKIDLNVDLNFPLHMEGIKFKIVSKNQITATYEKHSLNFGEIINYFNQIKCDSKIENLFIGKNFVFDDRLSEEITSDVISFCHQCGNKSDTHINCKNLSCNLLFIQCNECNKKNYGRY